MLLKVVGVEPSYMGIGPVPAVHLALENAGWTLDDVDLVEVNEAFAGQYLAVESERVLDRGQFRRVQSTPAPGPAGHGLWVGEREAVHVEPASALDPRRVGGAAGALADQLVGTQLLVVIAIVEQAVLGRRAGHAGVDLFGGPRSPLY